MIDIVIKQQEIWDEVNEQFITIPGATLHLEHSLKSLSEWESIWGDVFLNTNLTKEQTRSYIKCMCLNRQEVDPDIFDYLTNEHVSQIADYISSPKTATFFGEDKSSKKTGRIGKKIVTAEVIYYWMTVQNIPFECENWNLDRLLTLIRVCSEENNPDKKKMSKRQLMTRNAALNAARRARLNSKG